MPASYSARACFKATNCEHCESNNGRCPCQASYLRDQDRRQEIIICHAYRRRYRLDKEHEAANASAQLALLDTTEPVQTTLF